jgi:hypothetical protein
MDASQQIDAAIGELGDWRGELMTKLRRLINDAAPELKEAWKWGIPVWTSKGNVVALGAFKEHVKVHFFKGPQLADPSHLFNAGLDAKATRSIDIREDDSLDETALQDLVRAAVALDQAPKKAKA